MTEYREPKDFAELVKMLETMDENEYCENDDIGNFRVVEVCYMKNGKYQLYENGEFVGCTHDVVAAASFVAEGWEYELL